MARHDGEVPLAGLSVYIRPLNLHDCFKNLHVFFFLRRFAYLMKHTPRGIVSFHAKFPFNLSRNADMLFCTKTKFIAYSHMRKSRRMFSNIVPFNVENSNLQLLQYKKRQLYLMVNFVCAYAFLTHIYVFVLRGDYKVCRVVFVRKTFCKIGICHRLYHVI